MNKNLTALLRRIMAAIIIVGMSSTKCMAAEVGAGKKISIKMTFAGDCTLGSDFKYGKSGSFVEVYEQQKQPHKYFLQNVKEIFENDDLTVVNLEGPLTKSTAKADKRFAFRGAPEYVNILVEGDVEVVNLANNHTYDYGEKGYTDTQNSLKGVGIGYYGRSLPYIAKVKEVNVGFLGYVAWNVDKNIKTQISNDIKKLKEDGADMVVATFHWGDEAVNYPNDTQKTLGRYAIDSGADLVIGHHPHVMQPIEEYRGKYIVYSLGNFSFGGNRNPKDKDTFIFQQVFEFYADTMKMVGNGGNVSIYTCSVSSVKNKNDFIPTPLTGDDAQRVLDRMIKYSLTVNSTDIISKFNINPPVTKEEPVYKNPKTSSYNGRSYVPASYL